MHNVSVPILGTDAKQATINEMLKSVHTPEYRNLLALLAEARLAAGLSQRQLAVRLGVSHTWVAKIEAAERRIDVVEMARFCDACGADLVAIVEKWALFRKPLRRTLQTKGPNRA